MYSRRRSSQRLASTPLFISSAFNADLVVDATNPFNPFGYDLVGPAIEAEPDQGQLLLLGRRQVEAGPRVFSQDVQTRRFGAGLDGPIRIMKRAFNWQLNFTLSDNKAQTRSDGLLNTERLRRAIGPLDVCLQDPQCTPLNLFGGQGPDGRGTITRQMLDYVVFDGMDSSTNQLRSVSLLLTGTMFDAPAGPVATALGYEHRDEYGSDRPDVAVGSGATGGFEREPTRGGFSVDEVFLELSVPVLSNVPWFEELRLSGALRLSEYDTFGHTSTATAGLIWQPAEDVMVRASFAQGFRAPNINELFAGRRRQLAILSDPCSNLAGGGQTQTVIANCIANGVPADGSYIQDDSTLVVEVGSNPALEPETSDTVSIGMVHTPSWAANLSIELDWYRIELDNTITAAGGQTILNTCAQTSDIFCELIHRVPGGAISSVIDANINIGGTEVEGVDLLARYIRSLGAAGELKFVWNTSYATEFDDIVPSPSGRGSATAINRIGTNPGDHAFPRIKSNLDTSWRRGRLSASWRLRYVGDQMETCSDYLDGTPLSLSSLGRCSAPGFDSVGKQLFDANGNPITPRNSLGGTTYHDLQFSYGVLWFDTELTIGMHNVFDKAPPVSTQAFANSFDPTVYELPGRFSYIRVSAAF